MIYNNKTTTTKTQPFVPSKLWQVRDETYETQGRETKGHKTKGRVDRKRKKNMVLALVHFDMSKLFQLLLRDALLFGCTEVRAMGRDVLLKEDNEGSSMANGESENKHDSSEVFPDEVEFTVGKSPASNNITNFAEALGNERGVSGLGEGTPKVILLCAILLVVYMKQIIKIKIIYISLQKKRLFIPLLEFVE